MVEFVTNNAILLIIGGIILIMALIGYFAENSELGKKVMQAKPKKKEKNSAEKIEDEQTSTDVWTENVNTDENEKEIITNNDVNNWLDGPLDFSAQSSENSTLNEVNVSPLSDGNYSSIEVLDYESDNDFDSIEVLDYSLDDEKENKDEVWT